MSAGAWLSRRNVVIYLKISKKKEKKKRENSLSAFCANNDEVRQSPARLRSDLQTATQPIETCPRTTGAVPLNQEKMPGFQPTSLDNNLQALAGVMLQDK